MMNDIEKVANALSAIGNGAPVGNIKFGKTEYEFRNIFLIGANATEKQIPKEVINQGINAKTGNWTILCPDCGVSMESPRKIANYCANCGQALKVDWNDNDV